MKIIKNNDNSYNISKYADIKSIIQYFIDVKKLEDNFDEPFYIIDLQKLEYMYKIWTKYLPNIKPYYAIKSNPDKNIIKKLYELGCNFDCASKNEIKTILELTNDNTKIIYANPCKSISYIQYAKNNNISLMTFDCIEELHKIYSHYPEANIILRIAVDDSNSLCKFNYKFGCKTDNDTITNIFEECKKIRMNIYGISFHVGSGCNNSNNYYEALRKCRNIYNIAKKYDNNIEVIDIGGGFYGIDKIDNISFAEIVDKIKNGQEDFFGDIPNIKYIAEPGRYFSETCQILVVNIIAKKKETDVIKYYINDGIYGSFNCIDYDYQNPQIIQLKTSKNKNKYNSIFFGPTCDSIDIIYDNINITELEIGDWLYIENFGSYTNATDSSFNGFKTTEKVYLDIK